MEEMKKVDEGEKKKCDKGGKGKGKNDNGGT
jgi:hypothetical protein